MWIQTSEGTLIKDSSDGAKRWKRGLDFYLMVDGVSLGKIRSYNKGEFYELVDLCETFPRWKMIHFLNHAANMNIEEVFENFDYVLDVSVAWDPRYALKQCARLKDSCDAKYPVQMKCFRKPNRERVYVLYTKTFRRNRTWSNLRDRMDRHVYL